MKKPCKISFNTLKKSKPFVIGLVLFHLAMFAGTYLWHRSQRTVLTEPVRVYIPTGATYQQVVDSLETHQCIKSNFGFSLWSSYYGLKKHAKGGSYVVEPTMSSMQFVRKLNNGEQDAIRLTINKHRTKEQLCDFLATKLELTADSMLAVLNDSAMCAAVGCNSATVIGLFIQNTYEVYWNSSPQKLMERMQRESKAFWNEQRESRCKALGLSAMEVMIIASIVEEETNKNDEKGNVASVYINRLRKEMLLQADPTVKYAEGDFTIRRIVKEHLVKESPYNTYLNKGLPPGPICIPSVASIDAVLQSSTTPYLYFCAKEDFSGYHNFAATYEQHKANARRFHQALNQRGIK